MKRYIKSSINNTKYGKYNTDDIEAYATGGGWYNAELRIGDVLVVVNNIWPNVITYYHWKPDSDEIFTDENMIVSKNINEFDSDDEKLYNSLIQNLIQSFPEVQDMWNMEYERLWNKLKNIEKKIKTDVSVIADDPSHKFYDEVVNIEDELEILRPVVYK